MIVGDALVGGGGQQYLGNATEPLVSETLGQRSKPFIQMLEDPSR